MDKEKEKAKDDLKIEPLGQFIKRVKSEKVSEEKPKKVEPSKPKLVAKNSCKVSWPGGTISIKEGQDCSDLSCKLIEHLKRNGTL